MAINKLALIRYRTIDQCLGNRYRKWTLEDLIDKVSQTLYEHEGIVNGVSKRTIQADIQFMRSDKLGYNAPIIVTERRYYSYKTAGYSINQSRLTDADIEKMNEVVGVLQQMSGFDHFSEMNDIITRLRNSLRKTSMNGQNLIQLEGNRQLKGIEHVAPLYQCIVKQVPLLISYQSFRAPAPVQKVYFPYLLKEYRNRWFLICRAKSGKLLLNLALDRIVEFMEMSPKDYEPYTGVDFERYYGDIIGVTKNQSDRAQKVVLFIDQQNAPYVITKPLHPSQTVLKELPDGVLIRLDVVINFELEREILGFGECVRVLSPRLLEKRVKARLTRAVEAYATKPPGIN